MPEPRNISLRAHEPTLRELLELKITELEKRIELKLLDAKEARILAAEIAKDQRAMAKEVTEELRLQAAKYPTKEAIEARTGEQGRMISALDTRQATTESKISNMEGRLWAFGTGLTFIFAAITLVLRLVGR